MTIGDSLPASMAIVVATVALSGCGTVDPLSGNGTQATPAFYAKNVKGYGETAAGLRPDQVLGHDLTVVGDVARWHECSSLTECTTVERTRPAADLVGVERIGEATIDGRKTDVVKLSLTARPKYIVPTWKP